MDMASDSPRTFAPEPERVWEPSRRWAQCASEAGGYEIDGGNRSMKFEVAAEPVGQPRPRFRIMRMGRRLIGKAYSPTGKHSELKRCVIASARETLRASGMEPFGGPVAVGVECWMPKAKSNRTPRWWSTIKPDIDNIVKCVLDGLNDAGVWRDDAQVSALVAEKIDTPGEDWQPCVFVTITELPVRIKEPARRKQK